MSVSTLPHSDSATQSLVPSIQILMATIITATECDHHLEKVSQHSKVPELNIINKCWISYRYHVHD